MILCPYPQGTAPSQRFRFEQYLDILRKAGWEIEQHPFYSERSWQLLYKPGRFTAKVLAVISGFIRRFGLLFRLRSFGRVFIHREAAPIGPPLIEWLISRFHPASYIYDFDDAVWLPNSSEANRAFVGLKQAGKFSSVCKWASRISAGNHYLAEKAASYSSAQVDVIPTTIDTDGYHNRSRQALNKPLVFGWTGTHSTLRYLDELVPVFRELESKAEFKIRVISDQPPAWKLDSMEFIQWQKETEIDDLLGMDVGLMPLEADAWSAGKCGFKALQYMALGIPAIASPVGVNSRIIRNAENGWLPEDNEQWAVLLESIIRNPDELREMGQKARARVIEAYSVRSNQAAFMALFE